jgi:hypothetical protein
MPHGMSQEDFLKLMSQIESSGGKQLNHPPATHGISAGQHAIGQYGLMPQTSFEVLHPPGGQKFPTDPNLLNYLNLDKDQLAAEIAKNPQLEKGIAEQYSNTILNRARSPEEAAMMWNSGPNVPFNQDQISSSPRALKFQQLRNSLSPSPSPVPEDEDQE